MRQAKDRESLDDPAFEQFADDQQGFNRFANANVIGHEQTNRLVPQGHDERNYLVGARTERQLRQTAEQASAIAKSET